MAMNPFKKTHQPRDGEIVASAAVDLTKAHDVNLLRTVLAQGKPRAAKAWKWYGDIGEVHYAVSRSARVAGYAQLVPRKILPNGGLGEVIKGGMEADIASMSALVDDVIAYCKERGADRVDRDVVARVGAGHTLRETQHGRL